MQHPAWPDLARASRLQSFCHFLCEDDEGQVVSAGLVRITRIGPGRCFAASGAAGHASAGGPAGGARAAGGPPAGPGRHRPCRRSPLVGRGGGRGDGLAATRRLSPRAGDRADAADGDRDHRPDAHPRGAPGPAVAAPPQGTAAVRGAWGHGAPGRLRGGGGGAERDPSRDGGRDRHGDRRPARLHRALPVSRRPPRRRRHPRRLPERDAVRRHGVVPRRATGCAAC